MLVDMIFLSITGYGVYWGYTKGIINTIVNILTYFISILLAMRLTPFAAQFFKSSLQSEFPFIPIVAFLVMLAICFWGVQYFRGLLVSNFKSEDLNLLNRIGGAFILGWFFAVLASGFITFFVKAGTLPNDFKDSSVFYGYIEQLPSSGYNIVQKALPVVQDFWEFMKETLDDVATPAAPTQPTTPSTDTMK